MNEFEIVQHPQIEGINLFFDTLDYRTPHLHPEWELLWVLEGSLAIACGERAARVDPGGMALLPPRQAHEFRCVDKSCTFLCLQVSPRLLLGFPALDRLRVEGMLVREHFAPAEYQALQGRLRELTRAYLERPPFYELFCAGQVCLLWHRLLTRLPCRTVTAQEAAQEEKRSARAQRLIRFVDENYMHPIRLADFARQEGCSLNHMSAFVRQTLNQSFQEYVNTVRFHCACRLIALGDARMTDVCFAAGFSDYRYFSRAFQQRLGMTPEEYSRQAQPPVEEQTKLHRSIHSLERLYSREKSLELLALL